uniref:Ras association domain-containing protein 5-like n=1 Tax=Phallusia mammillata TaxID=59560 RepID=A0A6F9DPS6_9ASCI|nr:ras association domain-containing protein 5-like [Phallusia mammillata]
MRHVGQSGPGSPKKSASKVNNQAPKPFVVGTASSGRGISSVNPPRPKNTVPNRWQNNNSNFTPAKGLSKPERSPSPKVSKDLADIMPKLNEAHVQMFTSKEAAINPSLHQAKKKAPTPVATQVTPVTKETDTSVKSMANRFQPNQTKNNAKSPPAFPKKQSYPQPKPLIEPVKKTVPASVQAEKKPTPMVSPPKPTTPAVVARVNATNSASTKWSPPSVAAAPPPAAVQNTAANKPKPASNKPPKAWQRAGPPLSQEKSTSPSTPPTAVVAPMQPKPTSPPVKKATQPHSPDVGRSRAVSSPVIPPKSRSDIVVSYQRSSEDVVLPEMVSNKAEKQSTPQQQRKPRANSEITKKPKATTNIKPAKVGHDFQPHELKEWVNWCDACGSVILSLFGKCVTCTKCKMVCHGKCALTVSLTCEADQQQARSLTLNETSALSLYKTIVQETTDESTLKEYNTIQRVISIEEIQQKIEEFNLTVKGSQQMTLQEDGETFRGFIRVTMNLTRPVSVMDAAKTSRKNPKKSSFYIDKGAVKALHLTSDTTAAQVVQALLTKYNISDNPMKFALFEKQFREEGHVILRKMLPKERPLFLRLLWGNGSSEKKGFILQENESRDIHWESFSVGELQMFIKILDKEENDYITEIKCKYKNRSQDIRQAIDHQNKKG